MLEQTKTCSKCRELKSLHAFSKDSSSKSGTQSHCKECHAVYYQCVKDEKKLKQRIYYHKTREARVAANKRYRSKNRVRAMLGSIKHRAKKKGIPFNLCLSDIVIPECCPLLGIKLQFNSKILDNSPSLDQIIPGLGYTKENTWIISARANRIKNDATPQELVHIGRILAEQFPHLANANTKIQNKPNQETI